MLMFCVIPKLLFAVNNWTSDTFHYFTGVWDYERNEDQNKNKNKNKIYWASQINRMQ